MIDAGKHGNETRFINHSERNKNVVPQVARVAGMRHLIFIAIKDIPAGKQILFDYGRGYWKLRGPPKELEP